MDANQESLLPCAPLPYTTKRNGYVSHCACGWFSAVEYLKRHAAHALSCHLNDSLHPTTLSAPDPFRVDL